MQWRNRHERRIKKELKEATRIEERIAFLVEQKFSPILKEYEELILPYWSEGQLDIVSFNRDKTYNREFRNKINKFYNDINLAAAAATREVNKEVSEFLYGLYGRSVVKNMRDMGLELPLVFKRPYHIIEAIESNFVDGKTFSQRIWASADNMEYKLKLTLSESINNGYSIPKTTKQFQAITGQNVNNCRRVIRTETIATYSKASLDSYSAAGVEEVEVLENQRGVCPICSPKDGNKVKMVDARIGVNIPPFHSYCRGTIAPIIQ